MLSPDGRPLGVRPGEQVRAAEIASHPGWVLVDGVPYGYAGGGLYLPVKTVSGEELLVEAWRAGTVVNSPFDQRLSPAEKGVHSPGLSKAVKSPLVPRHSHAGEGVGPVEKEVMRLQPPLPPSPVARGAMAQWLESEEVVSASTAGPGTGDAGWRGSACVEEDGQDGGQSGRRPAVRDATASPTSGADFDRRGHAASPVAWVDELASAPGEAEGRRDAKREAELENANELAEAGLFGEAEAAYLSVLVGDADCVDALIGLGRLYSENGDVRAELHFSRALRVHPWSALAACEMGDFLDQVTCMLIALYPCIP